MKAKEKGYYGGGLADDAGDGGGGFRQDGGGVNAFKAHVRRKIQARHLLSHKEPTTASKD
uniref:Macrophage migration inhibitory factor homolog isoform X2 n=1 Tax=Rhizophora mucronata TaxID=61149 RepID=A0A2P2K2E2_RHIMU